MGSISMPQWREIVKQSLIEYNEGFEDRNPGLELIGAYIHMDEASPHMHFDYIPVAEGYKTGVQNRNSLDRAMRNLIAVRTGSEYSPSGNKKSNFFRCN